MTVSPLVDAAVRRVLRTRPSIDAIATAHNVRGALFGGAAGVAFFLHEAARLRDPSLLDAAERWIAVAEAWARRATDDEWEPAQGVRELEARWGHLHGLGGIGYVRILVSAARHDDAGIARGVEMLARACARVRRTSLFFGAAGLLRAVDQVRGRVGANLEHDVRGLATSMRALLDDHLATPLAERPGLAFALSHGVAGELWAVMASDGGSSAAMPQLEARLGELAELGEADRQAIVWPVARGQPFGPMGRSLCNGMTGHAVLWTTIARRGGKRARATAALVAKTFHLLGPAPDPSLCCGLAGQAAVYRVIASVRSREAELHRGRARARLRRAVASCLPDLDRPDGLRLWRGPLGVATIALLHAAGESHIPCFETAAPRTRP